MDDSATYARVVGTTDGQRQNETLTCSPAYESTVQATSNPAYGVVMEKDPTETVCYVYVHFFTYSKNH